MWVLVAVGCLFWIGGDVGSQPPSGPIFGKKKPAFDGPRVEPGTGVAQPPWRRWEYHVRSGQPTQTELNKLGDDGWELVAIQSSEMSRGIQSVYVFKRLATSKAKADDKGAPPPDKGKESAKLELRTYVLKHASASDMAQLLDDVLRINKYVMRIAADSRTNQIIVNATTDAHEDIGLLLQRLDLPGDNVRPGIGGPPPGGFKKK
jgi:hypothetical protein